MKKKKFESKKISELNWIELVHSVTTHKPEHTRKFTQMKINRMRK